ncbi:MAG: hypothetical protein KJ072_10655 [Verrucomicrobia bacterium]|nr:hypothetical protein [Verrucomicrobiota bacterium]
MNRRLALSLIVGGCLAALLLWTLKPARPNSTAVESLASPDAAAIAPAAPAPASQESGNLHRRLAQPSSKLQLTEAQQEFVDAVQGNPRLAQVSSAALQAYLDDNRRSAGSLLTAHQATQDPAYLTEAATQYSADPRVQYALAMRPDQSPSEKREWLERLKVSTPDNALATYLSAREYLKQGQKALALEDLALATRQPEFNPYVWEAMIDAQELLMADGASPAAAKVGSLFNAALPHLSQIRQLGTELSELQAQYALGRDLVSFDTVTQLGLELAQRLNNNRGGGFLIDQLVGMAIEQTVLKNVDSLSAPEYLGMTVQERLDQLADQKAEIKALAPLAENILPSASEAELVTYLDRVRVNGELEALRWLKNRQP